MHLDGSHRVSGAQLHGNVHIGGLGDTALHQPDRLADVRHKESVHDKARLCRRAESDVWHKEPVHDKARLRRRKYQIKCPHRATHGQGRSHIPAPPQRAANPASRSDAGLGGCGRGVYADKEGVETACVR